MLFSNYNDKLFDAIKTIDEKQIDTLIDLILTQFKNDKVIFVIGNGGSAANASHFAQDLAKGTRKDVYQINRIKAMSLTDNLPFITALGNDDGFETIFEQQLRTFANSGDMLIAISGSGNSPNIIKAVDWANANGLVTVGVTGFDGGQLKKLNKYGLHVPLNDMCTTESIHSIIFHYVVLELNRRI